MRAGHAAENMAVLRHLVRNLLEREQSQPGRSLRGKRLQAGWDNGYLLKILAGNLDALALAGVAAVLAALEGAHPGGPGGDG